MGGDADQDWGLDWHLNEGLEITFVTHGRAGSPRATGAGPAARWVAVTRPVAAAPTSARPT